MSFFNDTATTDIYTLSLHDALPIFVSVGSNDLIQYVMAADRDNPKVAQLCEPFNPEVLRLLDQVRSEEDTSELQSRQYLVCRLLLENKQLPRRPRGEDERHHRVRRD